MTDKATHTPLPWERQTLETEYDPGVYIVGSNLGGLVGAALPWPTEIESGDYSRVEANAALIVQAVNSHHDLIEALREARTSLSITRTNIMCEIGRCADPSESRWAGVPEQLAKRIAKIDAIITKEAGQ